MVSRSTQLGRVKTRFFVLDEGLIQQDGGYKIKLNRNGGNTNTLLPGHLEGLLIYGRRVSVGNKSHDQNHLPYTMNALI